MTIRCRLRDFRRAHGVSLSVLAAGTGIALSTLSKMERDKTDGYERATLDRIIRYFRGQGWPCELTDLLVYEPDPPGGTGEG